MLLRTALTVPVPSLTDTLTSAVLRAVPDGEEAANILVAEPFFDPVEMDRVTLDTVQKVVSEFRPFRCEIGPVQVVGMFVFAPVQSAQLTELVTRIEKATKLKLTSRGATDAGGPHLFIDRVSSAKRLKTLQSTLAGRVEGLHRVTELRMILHSPAGSRTAVRFPLDRKRWVQVRSLQGPGGPLL